MIEWYLVNNNYIITAVYNVYQKPDKKLNLITIASHNGNMVNLTI